MGAVSEAAKAYHRKCVKESAAWYREHGFCPRCQAIVTDGRVYCPACLKKYRDERNARYTPEQQREYSKARRAKLKAQGMCVVCGRNKAREGKTYCAKCTQKIKEARQAKQIHEKIQKEAKQWEL